MAAALVVLANFADFLNGLPDEPVDERGLSNTRRTQQCHGLTRPEILVQLIKSLSGNRAQYMNRNAESRFRHGFDRRRRIVAKIGFAEKNNGLRAALPNRCEISFDSPNVQIGVE